MLFIKKYFRRAKEVEEELTDLDMLNKHLSVLIKIQWNLDSINLGIPYI